MICIDQSNNDNFQIWNKVSNGTLKLADLQANGMPSQCTVPVLDTPVVALTLGGDADSAVEINWQDVTNAASYSVEQSTSEFSGWAIIASPTASFFEATGLTTLTGYYFRVKAIGEENSPYSVVKFITTE